MKTPLQHAFVAFATVFLVVVTALAPSAAHAQEALPPSVAFPPQTVVPQTTGTTMHLWNNLLNSATFTCSWNVAM